MFTGWSGDDADCDDTTATCTFATIAEAKAVTATFALEVYTVTFDGNGGTGCVADQTSAFDNVQLTLNTCTQSGYSFSGWNTSSDGLGIPFANGGLYDFASDGSDTLFAQWTSTGGGGGGGGGSPTSEPINTVSPELSGYTTSGETLVATSGTWEGATSYTFQWYRCTTASAVTQATIPAGCVTITGAQSATYVIQSTDSGFWLRVRVRATGSGGTTTLVSATSSKVGPKPASAKARPPRVTGLASVGQTLTAKKGRWINAPATYAYQWYRCTKAGFKNPKGVPVACTAITGASLKTYKVKAADKGFFLRVFVTATGTTGQASRMSRTTGLIPR